MNFILLGTLVLSLFTIDVFNMPIDGLFSVKKDVIINDVLNGVCAKPVDKINFVEDLSLLFGPARNNYFSNFEANSSSSAVFDVHSGIFVYDRNADKGVQIASISKLMSALVFLDYNPGWEKIHKMERRDRVEGGSIYLYLGEKIKIKDLFHTSLIASANTATLALVHETRLSEECFVEKMNKKAIEMGLRNTYFKDSVGLSCDNVSTAVEVAKIANIAFKNKDITSALSKKIYQFETEGGKLKELESTNELLNINNGDIVLKVGKTGYTDIAGYCFVAMFQRGDRDIISVILGAKNNNDRFEQAEKMSEWVFNNYNYE